jgi:uncharacterized protein
MRGLGVGLVYTPELAPLFDADGVVDVLELEPQGFWQKLCGSGSWRYVANQRALDRIAAYPHAKLMHGIGQPFGGSTDDPVPYLDLLRTTADALQPAWVSEHLSFNRVRRDEDAPDVGFLLPPRQSPAGVRVAVDRIGRYRRALGRPVAFETGVNYLQPRATSATDAGLCARSWHSCRSTGCGSCISPAAWSTTASPSTRTAARCIPICSTSLPRSCRSCRHWVR